MTQKVPRGRTKYRPQIKVTIKQNEFDEPQIALAEAKRQGKQVERFRRSGTDRHGRVFEVTLYRLV